MRARLENALHAAWRRKGGLSLALWPLSRLYALAVAQRRSAYLRRPERIYHETVPVVVVGNIYVGGTGKTPVVIALVQALQARGWQPGVISRGYGARAGDKPQAGRGQLDPARFGDEPALIAAETQVPVCVHPDRPAALQRLRRQYPQVDVVISDDGLQHLALGRDLEIVVQDARGVGNGRLLPAGPLREPPVRLENVDLIINNLQAGESPPPHAGGLARVVNMMMQPVSVEHLVSGRRQPWKDWLDTHGNARCTAVAAIGRPERFFDMLRQHGLAPAGTVALPDHHAYELSPFTSLEADCLLITPKDAVKCRKFDDPRLFCVHPGPHFSDPGWLDFAHDMLQAIARFKSTAARSEALHSDY